MRTLSLLAALVIATPLVFSDDKESGNKLKVKINHKFEDTESKREYEFQFKYDTDEWLHITNQPERSDGIYLRRNEVDKFKAIVEKMLKFGGAVYKNQITGVEKEFEGEEAILPARINGSTEISIDEDVKTPFNKTYVRVYWSSQFYSQSWDLRELEEISKIFDEKQKEVFKKYDLLKALND